HRASQRVQELLRDLLNVTRGQARNREVCRLRDILEAAAESARTENSGTRINIAVDEASEIVADRTRVERVFTNLFSNAVEAMDAGGEISIYAKDCDHSLNVFVEDTGPGIPPHIRSQVFRPFTTGKRSGLGLGLTLSRQTMMEHGGDLQ